jgi:mono/diheme cytochrome c family protein
MRAATRSLLAAALFTTFASAALAQGQPGNAGRGEALARTHCAQCHAIGPRDASRNPKAPPLREIAGRYDPENLQEALTEGITVGHEGVDMPEFVFSPGEADDIIAFLRRIGGRK